MFSFNERNFIKSLGINADFENDVSKKNIKD